MFAAILRRWRLVTPLALAVMAVAIVTSGVLASASAHTVHFHFWGRATVLEDNSIVLPDWACDTGPLSSLDGTAINVDTGHCIPIFGQNSTFGQNEVGDLSLLVPIFNQQGVIATAQFANATVKTDNTKKEGHTISTADAEGLNVFLPNVTFAVPNGGGAVFTGNLSLLTAVELTTTAEAECELGHSGHVHASARATSSEIFNDLFVLEGFHVLPDPDGDNDAVTLQLAHLTGSGEPNQSFPIFNIITATPTVNLASGVTQGFAEQITLNEQRSFHDGGIAWIHATGVHIIMTDFAGTVILNLSINVVFAAIHCEKHLPSDDAIGA